MCFMPKEVKGPCLSGFWGHSPVCSQWPGFPGRPFPKHCVALWIQQSLCLCCQMAGGTVQVSLRTSHEGARVGVQRRGCGRCQRSMTAKRCPVSLVFRCSATPCPPQPPSQADLGCVCYSLPGPVLPQQQSCSACLPRDVSPQPGSPGHLVASLTEGGE